MMAFEFSKVLSTLGDDVIADVGDKVGLDRDQSLRVARSLAAHMGRGGDDAIKAAAADTGLDEEVVSAMSAKLIDEGKTKLLEESPVGDAIEKAKADAAAAFQNAGGDMAKKAGGMLGGLFGRR